RSFLFSEKLKIDRRHLWAFRRQSFTALSPPREHDVFGIAPREIRRDRPRDTMGNNDLPIVRTIRRMLVEPEPTFERFFRTPDLSVHRIRVRSRALVESC